MKKYYPKSDYCIYFLLLHACIFFSVAAFSQAGTLDSSFGNSGKILDTSTWADCRAMTMQPDGKILIGGHHDDLNNGMLYVGRYNTDGTIDYTFGDNGKVFISNANGALPLFAKALAIQSDNKIVVCGRFITNSPYGGVGIIRLNPDGKIDKSFGKNGFVITRLSKWNDIIGGMALQSDGKIIVSGNTETGFSEPGPDFLLRYNSDGNLDNGFGDNGVVYTTYNSNVYPGAIKLQPDGKILTGDIYGAGILEFQLTRYNSDGSLDNTFGEAGIVKLAPQAGNFESLNDITIQSDLKIVVAGEYGNAMTLARFDSSGKVDLDFGEYNGYSYFYVSGTVGEAKNVFISTAKKIIITGSYFSPNSGAAVLQYNENGLLDSSFGENGIATAGFDDMKYGADITSGEGLLQKDGKIIVSGSFLQNHRNTYNVALFRYLGDKQEKYVHIKHWLHKRGITWEDKPGNLSYYAVERSCNGNAFTEIAKVYSHNNQTQFSYEDAAALSGTNYYRLRIVSKDGAVMYSNIVEIADDNNAIKIFPNPAQNNLQIEGLSALQQTKLTVLDFSGNIKATAITNNSSYNLNVSRLKQGNYILRIEANDNVVIKKFVKE